MSFAVTAVVASASVAFQAYSAHEANQAQKKAAKQAKEDAAAAELQAAKARTFSETEGAGTGQLGKVSLAIDDKVAQDTELDSKIFI